jgi:hypothetical protein
MTRSGPFEIGLVFLGLGHIENTAIKAHHSPAPVPRSAIPPQLFDIIALFEKPSGTAFAKNHQARAGTHAPQKKHETSVPVQLFLKISEDHGSLDIYK